MKYNIAFTKEELKSLLSFIDAGVRSSGLQAAETAVYFKKKIESAIEDSETPEEEEDD